MCFAIAFVTSFVVMGVLPITRISAWCATSLQAQPGTLGHEVVSNIFTSTLLMLFLGLVMTSFITGIGTSEAINTMTGLPMKVNLFDRYIALCISFWPIIIIVAFLCNPLATKIASLLVKEELQ